MKPQTSTDLVRVFAPAKINLCLHVGAKRPDGFHDLASLVVFADVGDELLLGRNEDLSLVVSGPFSSGLPADDDNLVLRAARQLAEMSGHAAGARIVLEKNLPVASGIGGGSADAAATLRGLASLWSTTIDENALAELAAKIGSDVPMCLFSKPALAGGRGEKLSFLPSLPKFSLVLVNPGVAVSTAQVFSKLQSRHGAGFDAPPQFGGVSDVVEFLDRTSNDLQRPATELAPEIGTVLEAFKTYPEVLLARLSGSGATCFGLVGKLEIAEEIARDIRRLHPDWWVATAALADSEHAAARPA